MSISGDIDISAGSHISLLAGNDIYDHARIGHGGAELADFETSSFILGDIRVTAGGDVSLTGGGSIQPKNRADNYDVQAWSQIGHGGIRSGFNGIAGDIAVDAAGNVVLMNGPFAATFAKIGHRGYDDRGQVGGNYTRFEDFRDDSARVSITTSLLSNSADVSYASVNGHLSSLVAVRDFAALGAGDLVSGALNTTNILVDAGGSITLDHMASGFRQPVGRPTENQAVVNNPDLGVRTNNSYAQIGHGGITTQSYNPANTAMNYQNKVGDIRLLAGLDVDLKNGDGQHRWSRIGHGAGRNEQFNDSSPLPTVSRALAFAGDISVAAGRNISINAEAAAANERIENSNATVPMGDASQFNPVAIGHGGINNNQDVVVLSEGDMINGVAASSNIQALAGESLFVLGGQGANGSYAQLGHGFASDGGDDAARVLGVPKGFSGNINISVDRDIVVRGGANAWSQQPDSVAGTGRSVTGALAVIGHGGYQLDAPSKGNITVYAGRDVSVLGQVRTDPAITTPGASPYNVDNIETGAVASLYNFAKIGHFSAEDGGRSPASLTTDAVTDSNQTGDITVVVGRDLTVKGGQTPDVDTQTIYGAFAQIGHGGPSISGDLNGSISVLVKRDLAVVRGSERGAGDLTTFALNNYAMIGHGDFLHDTNNVDPSATFRQVSRWRRDGDITIATGMNATFNSALIGHLDPKLSIQKTSGNTQIAVSRLNPFFGGEGILSATGGTVITSGDFGAGSQVEFYLPARSRNFMDPSTRINEVTAGFSAAPRDFAGPFNVSNGVLAGRADEVYLTPDLWWDDLGLGQKWDAKGAGLFPTDAVSGQGGSLALVNSPGGFPNFSSLSAGSLGDTAPVYRDNNVVSGAGLYTIYYDAIQPVATTPPAQPTEPVIPLPVVTFDFFGLPFAETYDAFFREEDLFNEGLGGSGGGLYALLGLFERDEDTQEGADTWSVEDGLDGLFGDRRDSDSQEEQDEEEESRIQRGNAGGPVGVTFYVYEPGTNRYSSYRVFGNQVTTFYPAN
jgi:hypothetical protein